MGNPNELVLTSNTLPKEWRDWKFEDGSDFLGLVAWFHGRPDRLEPRSEHISGLREPDRSNDFVLAIDPSEGTIGDVDETDGIDVTNVRTSSRFPSQPVHLQGRTR